MSIEDVIQRTGDRPVTVEQLVRDLRALGVEPGMTLLVHSSLSRIGFVCGGAQAVILALEESLGEAGTLVMPAHTGEWSDPAYWESPPVPESWWPVIREHWPAFDPDLTPSREMGAIAEAFRCRRGTLRSSHPQCSFIARGPNAERVTAEHHLVSRAGEQSPLARLYELDARVLLIGVGHANNTSLHYAEARADYPDKKVVIQSLAADVNGERRWIEYTTMGFEEDDFVTIGELFEAEGKDVTLGPIGLAGSRLMPQRALVDFAADWMSRHRNR